MTKELIKKAVGYRAAELIQAGMLVGLGTGSTVFFFIEKLIQRCKEGLKIQAVASSSHSLSLARKGNIPLIDIEKITALDITIDGADEIDSKKRMIKGGGGAHVREKILANMSNEMMVIIDESKLVSELGRCKLPVEVLPFAHLTTLHMIKKAGYNGKLRKKSNNSFFITDNHNLIIDIHFDETRAHPEKDHETLIHIPGVVDTGFFFNLAGRVLIGFNDGQVIIKP